MNKENKSRNKRSEKHYAAIDIGSNAVRLLIKHINENSEKKFSKVLLLRVPLRLGFDVFSKGRISEKKEKNMIRLMKSYRHLMKIYDVADYRACATSAMRDAVNGKDIIKMIEKKTGIKIEIITGQEEARMVYNNHIECMEDRHGNYMYVDVGGGSTEVNLLVKGELVCSKSYNIGTVRMLNDAVDFGEWKRLEADMRTLSEIYSGTNIIGSGGNINKLYRLAEKTDKKRQRISVIVLKSLYEKLKLLSFEERMQVFNLKPDRADVIVPASEIFLTIAEILHSEYIYVPVIGLADGIIDGLYAANRNR